MDTLIAGDDTWALWAERTSWGRRISGYAIYILLVITLSNLRVIPTSAVAYDVVWDYFVPLAIPLLLFKADLRRGCVVEVAAAARDQRAASRARSRVRRVSARSGFSSSARCACFTASAGSPRCRYTSARESCTASA